MAKGLPSTVKIAGIPYGVERIGYDEMLRISHSEDCIGFIGTHSSTIWILDALKQELSEATLLHEAIHAISNSLNLGISEEATCALGVLLRDFLVDNGFWQNKWAKEAKHGKVR